MIIDMLVSSRSTAATHLDGPRRSLPRSRGTYGGRSAAAVSTWIEACTPSRRGRASRTLTAPAGRRRCPVAARSHAASQGRWAAVSRPHAVRNVSAVCRVGTDLPWSKLFSVVGGRTRGPFRLRFGLTALSRSAYEREPRSRWNAQASSSSVCTIAGSTGPTAPAAGSPLTADLQPVRRQRAEHHRTSVERNQSPEG